MSDGAEPESVVTDYHAHVYFAPATRDQAVALRAEVAARFPETRLGRVWDEPVGPHPLPSYQIAFPPALFGTLVPFLNLRREGLTVFVHPNSGEDLPDHRDRAIWLGESHKLDLSVLSG
jgi:DOPA 4,5-dioxygenase